MANLNNTIAFLHLHQARKSVGVAVENNGWRRAAKGARIARVLVGGEAVDSPAPRIIHGPSVDAVAEILNIADTVVETRADGGDGTRKGREKEG